MLCDMMLSGPSVALRLAVMDKQMCSRGTAVAERSARSTRWGRLVGGRNGYSKQNGSSVALLQPRWLLNSVLWVVAGLKSCYGEQRRSRASRSSFGAPASVSARGNHGNRF